MIALVRAGWLLSAAVAGVIAASIVNVHFAGPLPAAALILVAAVCAARPRWGLLILTALIPVAWYSATRLWNAQVSWAEATACAGLVGLGLAACRHGAAVPRAAAAPALVFGAIVLASLAATQEVLAVREGPTYWTDLVTLVTHEYLVNHSAVALHAALLLLEGLLLFAHAARLGRDAGMLRAMCASTTIGAAAAAGCTLDRLRESAARATAFWPALFDLAGRLRWNVHYVDVNAAGSFYALALLAACGGAWTAARKPRPAWIIATLVIAAGLWLTSSRIAIVAVPLAAAAALLLPRAAGGRRQALGAAAIGIAAMALLALVTSILPQRGIQHSSLLAADIRVGLLETGARMIRAYPVFGVGVGAFQHRSPEFSSAELIAKFPVVAQGENAHNNFVQIAAETGVAGGLAFTWTIGVALVAAARRAAAGERLQQFAFAAITAFVLTMIAGHPLLVPEAAFAFWLFAGVTAGAAMGPTAARVRGATLALAASLLLVLLTLPLRVSAAVRDADLEHIGIGVTGWQVAPDGTRYREAASTATLFEPVGAFKFSVNPRTAAAVQLEVVIDGRVADVLLLQPNQWNEVLVAARNVQTDARFRRMDLRTLGATHPPLWITKDEPIAAR